MVRTKKTAHLHEFGKVVPSTGIGMALCSTPVSGARRSRDISVNYIDLADTKLSKQIVSELVRDYGDRLCFACCQVACPTTAPELDWRPAIVMPEDHYAA